MSENESFFWKVARGQVPMPPAAQLLGWELIEGEPGSGRIRVRFEATPAFANPIGNVQGGMLAAMLDETMGPALATTFGPDEFGPTLELKINFLRPAKPGPLFGMGEVVHRGGSVAFLRGELRDPEDRLVATATATARLIRLEAGGFER